MIFMAYKLSASSLYLFEECPRCFWLKLNKKISRPEVAFPSLPAGMDHILKEHFDSYTLLGELPPELNGKVADCKLFDDVKALRSMRAPNGSLKWEDEDGNVLCGAIDCLLVKGDRVIILDYKTRGYAIKEDTHKHYNNQMDIYAFLLQQAGYNIEDYAFLLFYFPKQVNRNGDFVFDSRLVRINVSPERARKLFRRGVEVLKGPMPAPSPDCGFCRWAEKLSVLY